MLSCTPKNARNVSQPRDQRWCCPFAKSRTFLRLGKRVCETMGLTLILLLPHLVSYDNITTRDSVPARHATKNYCVSLSVSTVQYISANSSGILDRNESILQFLL